MKYPRIEGAVKLQEFVRPMLAELSAKPAFTDSKWIFEIKWDGYRAIAETGGKGNRLYSRNGTSFSKAFPAVFNALAGIQRNAILDGEVVVFDASGKPSFQLLQNYSAKQKLPMQFQVFDILSLDGKDLCNLPLVDRKQILKELLPDSPVIRYCDHVETEGEMLFDQIVKLDMEGMIAKKSGSKYRCGSRSSDWLKIKNQKFDDFVIVGFLHTDSEQYIKSLVIGSVEKGKVAYRGCVSGFSDRTVREIRTLLNKDVVKQKPVGKHEAFDAPVSWVKPRHLCNVRYTEITSEGILRHPVFQGLKRGGFE